MTGRVFFYVQHLLGIGHLRRAATLARAMAAGGFDVLLVSGGSTARQSTRSFAAAGGGSCSTSSTRSRLTFSSRNSFRLAARSFASS